MAKKPLGRTTKIKLMGGPMDGAYVECETKVPNWFYVQETFIGNGYTTFGLTRSDAFPHRYDLDANRERALPTIPQMIEPKHITDDQLLGWIRDGTIFIDRIDTRSPRVFFNGYQLKPELIKQAGYKRRVEHNGTGSERWTIRFTNKGKRRRIVRSKLVFMYANDQTIPIGHEVDHEDEDRFNDSALNLTLMDLDAHLEKHYGKF